MNCNKDKIQCDFTKLQKLLDAKTAPKSTVCSRLSTYDGQFLTFGSMTELLKEICNTKAYCAMPPYEIDNIRELPAFNYEGPCHETKALLEKVKCPFGDKPMVMEGLSMLYAYCPYKIDLSRYPGPDPSHLRRASRSASPMKCLPEGNTLDERTNFYRSMDEKSYYLEVV
ncbi:unnamed protein product [Dracunculus medinensis]|uniref:Uncharacterized protein n=1 Tax=Dracunculus medinensis TaxID=318479 RepID=A0A3P7QEG6_DRAME|nr:unnamed protein product [Dracunculus medinensis]